MTFNPFRKPKPNAKREAPRRVAGREKLYGEAKTQRRREIFERSGGVCEAIVYRPWIGDIRCGERITWENFHWSHKAHAARKDDSLDGGIASCEECHRNAHNAGGKPVSRKPGRTMNKSEGEKYWRENVCFCEKPKPAQTAFCRECLEKLSPQSRLDLERLTGKDWLKAVADCEREILAAGVRG